jgi:glycosyltransferase involved in cell wall biosynthesis
LETAQALHATSAEEARAIRAAGLTQPIAVIPNGVELPMFEEGGGEREDWRSDFQPLSSAVCHLPSIRKPRTLLFVGRIHPNKGLRDLVKAWAQVRPAGWRVVIAGQDEAGHVGELRWQIEELGLESSFEFVGPVDGAAKWELCRAADVFALPSYSENFGVAVAEALACGVPVIATRGTPWEDLVVHRCGWWTNIGCEPLAQALRDAVSRTDEERREMGRRGRRLVEKNYSWPRIAAQMRAVYRWMLGQGAKPDCVVL